MDLRQFSSTAPTLREQEAQRLRLEKENFNLKMQIFSLEQRLQQVENPADDDEIRQENLQQRLLLEELQQEVEHKNLFLQKTTAVIQALKKQAEENGVMNADGRILREQLLDAQQRLREVQADSEKAADKMHTKISQLQKKLAQKETELAVAVDKSTRTQREKDEFEAELRRTKNEADLAQQQLSRLHQSIGSSADEITQLRLENDVLRIEVEQRASEDTAFEAKVSEVLRAKDEEVADVVHALEQLKVTSTKTEDDFKQRIKVLTEEYDAQVQTLKAELRTLNNEREQLLPLKARVLELSQSSQLAHEARASAEELENDNRKVRREVLALQEQLAQVTKQLHDAEEAKSRLQYQLGHLTTQLEGVKNSLNQAVEHAAEQQTEIQQLDMLNQQLSSQMSDSKLNKHTTNERLSQADKQISVLQRQCDRLSVEKSVLERDLGKTDAEHAKLQAKIDKLEQDLQQAMHELHVRDDRIVQLTSSNAILEATCSNAAELAKRSEAQQQELASCKDKLVEVTTLRELMKIAQTAQGAAEARCKDLQTQLEEQTEQHNSLRKSSWDYQQQLIAQQAHAASLEKLLDAERTQFRRQDQALNKCRKKLAVVDELFRSGQVRVVSIETVQYMEQAVEAMQEWHQQLNELWYADSVQQSRVIEPPLLVAANISFETFDGIDGLSEAIPQLGEHAHSETTQVLPALIESISEKLMGVWHLRREFYDQYNRLMAKWDRTHAELGPRVQSLDTKIVMLAATHHANEEMRQYHQTTLKDIEARHRRAIEEMSDELRVVAGEANGAKERLQVVQKQFEKSRSEAAEWRNRHDSTRQELERRNGEIEQITRHYESIQTSVAEMRQQLHSSKDQIERLAETNRTLTLELENQATHFEGELQRSEALATEKTTLLSAVHKLTEQIEARETVLAEHQEYIQKLKQKIERLKGRQRFDTELERSTTSNGSPLRQPVPMFTPTPSERRVHDHHAGGQPHAAFPTRERRPYDDLVSPRASKAADMSARRADRMERLNRMGEDLQTLGAQLDNILTRTPTPVAAHDFQQFKTQPMVDRMEGNGVAFGSSRARISRWANTQP